MIHDEEQLSDIQRQHLHELVAGQKDLLETDSKNEPKRNQIWKNIADKLNLLPGVTLSIEEWKKCVNWNKLIPQQERKKHKIIKSNKHARGQAKTKPNDVITIDPEDINIEYEIVDSQLKIEKTGDSKTFKNDDTQDYAFDENSQDEHIYDDEFGSDYEFLYTKDDVYEDEQKQQQLQQQMQHQQEQQIQHQQEQQHMLEQPACNNYDDDDDDDDMLDYEPQEKRLSVTPPLAKSFKFSKPIVTAVEKLNADVSDIKEVLIQTAKSLAMIEEILERQSKKQDETNALVKRNNQYLKKLVEYKITKRKSTHN